MGTDRPAETEWAFRYSNEETSVQSTEKRFLPEEDGLLSAEWNRTLTQQFAPHQVFYMSGAKSTSLLEKRGSLVDAKCNHLNRLPTYSDF